MGLTVKSTGYGTSKSVPEISKASPNDKIIALAGNPNVGKSTVFNALTGLRQHTGNWPGKTVEIACGEYNYDKSKYIIVDIPGTYSLKSRSPEEEVARDFIISGIPDATVVVCDATCLERTLCLALQTLEITDNLIICVNLLDEAKRKGISVNLDRIAEKLGVPVIGICAKTKSGLAELTEKIAEVSQNGNLSPTKIRYPNTIEEAIKILSEFGVSRKTAISYLEKDTVPDSDTEQTALENAFSYLAQNGIAEKKIPEIISSSVVLFAEEICLDTVTHNYDSYGGVDRKIDKLLTSRLFGYPVMLTLLTFILWLTVTGANYPSELLSTLLFSLEDKLLCFTEFCHFPQIVSEMLVFGVCRCLFWVVSVMLPPMAIFFPLFTLLEDLGFLPRIAFNLDHIFKKCKTCGKQALTMCMGLGCNAAGVVGCRIIDSPRERLIAIITNSLIPCNGKFPTIISVMTMFFAFSITGSFKSLFSAFVLTAVIGLGIILTFALSAFLSKTFLKGEPSAFCMELPPYRKPLIIKVLIRSILDRTLFVLGRAAIVAAPSGLIIWLMANISVNGTSLLEYCSAFLNPLGSLMGLDGVMIMAFILGFPANEIVMPIAIMAYMSGGTLVDISNLSALRELLIANGWTPITAICTVIFSLVHFPCSTTCITIYKETKSVKWTTLAFILPTLIGVILCILVNFICQILI